MSSRRLEFQSLLEGILGSPNVYFQPPPSVKMSYPAIIFSLDDMNSTFASNELYRLKKRYMVIVVDRDPDSKIPDKIATIQLSNFSRFYTKDNLNHFVFTVYF